MITKNLMCKMIWSFIQLLIVPAPKHPIIKYPFFAASLELTWQEGDPRAFSWAAVRAGTTRAGTAAVGQHAQLSGTRLLKNSCETSRGQMLQVLRSAVTHLEDSCKSSREGKTSPEPGDKLQMGFKSIVRIDSESRFTSCLGKFVKCYLFYHNPA